jgi:hypothetical protein
MEDRLESAEWKTCLSAHYVGILHNWHLSKKNLGTLAESLKGLSHQFEPRLQGCG